MTADPLRLGLIGGIGVAATLVYYQRLVAAAAARGGPLSLAIEHADVTTLRANNEADARDAQAQVYAGHLARLKAAGCDAAAITSLGGHFCFEETRAISPLPLVSAVAPLDAAFAAQGAARVGLLGTRVVMRTRLYGQLARTEAVAPPNLDAVHEAYIGMALAGDCTPEQRKTVFDAGRALVEAQGADAVVLAGTDLGLAFDGRDPGYKVIDAVDVHVAVLADLATGRRALNEVT
ncbi:MAG: aspartate/glutamate racemase family protein [Pseudomonadota bacterium]